MPHALEDGVLTTGPLGQSLGRLECNFLIMNSAFLVMLILLFFSSANVRCAVAFSSFLGILPEFLLFPS